MKFLAYAFAVLCGVVVVTIVSMYGYSTGDTDASRAVFAFFYGMIAVGALFGHAVLVRLWRHGYRLWPFLLGPILAVLLVVNLSNSLGAFASRGADKRAATTQAEGTLADDRATLKRKETERAAMVFTPTDAATVAATERASAAASKAREAECARRGDNCRARELDERNALAAEAAARASNAASIRASKLDAEIEALRARIASVGPIVETNSRGVAFANLFRLPRTAADWLATWQDMILAFAAEVLIIAAMISAELLPGRERKPKVAQPMPTKVEPVEPVEIVVVPQPQKRIASAKGSVIGIMTDLLEPGAGVVEFREAFIAYQSACAKRGKEAETVDVFADQLSRMCRKAKIAVEVEDGTPRLLRVQLKLTSS